MIYFYCQSYQALNMALALSQSSKVVIVTSSENIRRACLFLNIDFHIHTKFRISDLIFNEKRIRSELFEIRSLIRDDEFHFSHTQFAWFCFLLVKFINDMKGRTVFHDFEIIYSRPTVSSFFKKNFYQQLVYSFILRRRFNLPAEVRMSTKNAFMLSLNIDYIISQCYEINRIKDSYYKFISEKFLNIEYEFPEIDNLFIAQLIDSEQFYNTDKSKEVAKVLNSNCITIKRHPKLLGLGGFENCTVLPDYLPVEIFFSKVKNSIISIHSTSLVTAANLNIKVISLLDLVGNDDPFLKKVKDDLQLKSNHRINFIKSIKELVELIPELK